MFSPIFYRVIWLQVNMIFVSVVIMGLGFFLHIHNSSCMQFVIKVPDSDIGQVKQGWPSSTKNLLPTVINTWAFTNATKKGNYYSLLLNRVLVK